jgi:hypothetical protein
VNGGRKADGGRIVEDGNALPGWVTESRRAFLQLAPLSLLFFFLHQSSKKSSITPLSGPAIGRLLPALLILNFSERGLSREEFKLFPEPANSVALDRLVYDVRLVVPYCGRS